MKKKIGNNNESKILFDLIQNKYGNRLSSKELDEVRKQVNSIVETAKTLRSVNLEYDDEPFFVFTPYQKEE
ncbi:MAG: hypothetical protein JSV20_01150 [Candidatus Bathyarchaeota archaeon]|nr:MAG: hypothetical protein JSV20_01150 [Candidatus Bathyarchaeota archaeon]